MVQKPIDKERERSERKRTLEEFLEAYNRNLPKAFPKATKKLLTEYQASHKSFFRHFNTWTLGEQRKRFMDWVPQRIRELKKASETTRR